MMAGAMMRLAGRFFPGGLVALGAVLLGRLPVGFLRLGGLNRGLQGGGGSRGDRLLYRSGGLGAGGLVQILPQYKNFLNIWY